MSTILDNINWRMKENGGGEREKRCQEHYSPPPPPAPVHAFHRAGPTLARVMKLERFRGQSHPRKHLPHHLTVGTSRRIQTRDLLTAPTETLPSSFPSQTANVSAGGGHVSRSDTRPRGRCRAGGCASSQRNANPAASPLHLRLYVALSGFGPHCEPDAVMAARCKGVRGTEPGALNKHSRQLQVKWRAHLPQASYSFTATGSF